MSKTSIQARLTYLLLTLALAAGLLLPSLVNTSFAVTVPDGQVTSPADKVPQVRWAGEKIVLEKQFFNIPNCPMVVANFKLENQSPGTLEGIDVGIANLTNTADSVWTTLDRDGVARVILTSQAPGTVEVDCALYSYDIQTRELIKLWPTLTNEHSFQVFFLKLEGITLGNVVGERVDIPCTPQIEGHDSGIWNPENPYDPSSDVVDETLNTSEDTLLRANVKGWFMGDNLSWRDESYIDMNHNGTKDEGDIVLPAGRWVLPDDWEYLAGPYWEELRPQWDIMDQPDDDITADHPLGDYKTQYGGVEIYPAGTAIQAEWIGRYVILGDGRIQVYPELIAERPVIGPYNSLDINPATHEYTPFVNPVLGRKTVVPNGELNSWDCPMPPALVRFQIQDDSPGDIELGQGFFKEVDKADVYYKWISRLTVNPCNYHQSFVEDLKVYTNPYYSVMIPASPEIPQPMNNGGYKWDSSVDGTYKLWQFVDQEASRNPSWVEVYSDNHGEAMVYLNGDANYDPSEWPVDAHGYPLWVLPPNDTWDIPYGEVVGNTTIQAIADYPYVRTHQVVTSNLVEKHWTWGQEKLMDVEQQVPGNLSNPNGRKLVTMWVSDRDGFADVGMEIEWMVQSPARIEAFLSNTMGMTLNSESTIGISRTRLADQADVKRFADAFPEKFPYVAARDLDANGVIDKAERYAWAAEMVPSKYAVAGIYVTCSEEFVRVVDAVLYREEGPLTHSIIDTCCTAVTGLDFGNSSRVDPIVELSAGWNTAEYLGAPVSVEAALATVIDKVEAVWTYDAQAGEWLTWNAGVPGWVNTLDTLTAGTTYHIQVSEDCVWEY